MTLDTSAGAAERLYVRFVDPNGNEFRPVSYGPFWQGMVKVADGWTVVRDWTNGRVVEGVLTAEVVDEQGDIVPIDLIEKKMSWVAKNAVWLYRHGKTVPVIPLGQMLAWKRDGDRLLIRAGVWDEGNPIVDKAWAEIKAKEKQGGFSIGGTFFRECHGRVCSAKDLNITEFSWTDKPANPEAHITAVAKVKDADGVPGEKPEDLRPPADWWDACMNAQSGKYDEETARAVCGKIFWQNLGGDRSRADPSMFSEKKDDELMAEKSEAARWGKNPPCPANADCSGSDSNTPLAIPGSGSTLTPQPAAQAEKAQAPPASPPTPPTPEPKNEEPPKTKDEHGQAQASDVEARLVRVEQMLQQLLAAQKPAPVAAPPPEPPMTMDATRVKEMEAKIASLQAALTAKDGTPPRRGDASEKTPTLTPKAKFTDIVGNAELHRRADMAALGIPMKKERKG